MKPRKEIYNQFAKLENIYKESSEYNHEIQGYLKDFKVFELLNMETVRMEFEKDIEESQYLRFLGEDLIWDAYKEIVAFTVADTKPENV